MDETGSALKFVQTILTPSDLRYGAIILFGLLVLFLFILILKVSGFSVPKFILEVLREFMGVKTFSRSTVDAILIGAVAVLAFVHATGSQVAKAFDAWKRLTSPDEPTSGGFVEILLLIFLIGIIGLLSVHLTRPTKR